MPIAPASFTKGSAQVTARSGQREDERREADTASLRRRTVSSAACTGVTRSMRSNQPRASANEQRVEARSRSSRQRLGEDGPDGDTLSQSVPVQRCPCT